MKNKKNIENFAKVGTKVCEGSCDRDVVITKEGPVVICNSCKRIVIDNRITNK